MAVAVLLALAACSSSGSSQQSPSPAPSGQVSGTTGPGGGASAAPATWQVRLDGAVYGAPLVVGSTVVFATEGGSVVAVDAATGHRLWSRHVADPVPRSALPCGNIDPLGITGGAAFDPGTRRVFVVAETRTGGAVRHRLFGLDVDNGAVQVDRPFAPPQGDELATQQRPTLLVANGRVYADFGGLFGDCGTYFGAVVSSPTDGTGSTQSFVPAATSGKGAIWAPTGPALAQGGDLLVSSGNGDATAEPWDGSDSVDRLRPDLSLAASFHPASWADDNARDLDLGSTSPAVVGDYVVQIGKRGVLYVLRGTDLSLVSQLDVGSGGYGGVAVAGNTAYLPLTKGLTAVQISPDGKASVRWTQDANGTPVLVGNRVLAIDGGGSSTLRSYDAGTGQPGPSYSVRGTFTRFAVPAVVGSRAYVGTTTGGASLNLR
jgi:outer membrane protein assembly factor BamB